MEKKRKERDEEREEGRREREERKMKLWVCATLMRFLILFDAFITPFLLTHFSHEP